MNLVSFQAAFVNVPNIYYVSAHINGATHWQPHTANTSECLATLVCLSAAAQRVGENKQRAGGSVAFKGFAISHWCLSSAHSAYVSTTSRADKTRLHRSCQRKDKWFMLPPSWVFTRTSSFLSDWPSGRIVWLRCFIATARRLSHLLLLTIKFIWCRLVDCPCLSIYQSVCLPVCPSVGLFMLLFYFLLHVLSTSINVS